jgi:hypothetical protein
MKNQFKLFYLSILPLVLYLLHSCLQPYAPPEITHATSYLVVDGSLNVNPLASSQIKLSRTQNVQATESPEVEREAKVSVEGDKGSNFSFTEVQPGTYTLGTISYLENEKFRLRIKTKAGKEYISLHVPAMQTPTIDSVTYRVSPDNTGVQINVNTHDPLNKTHFYRWNFEETWQYQMPLYSGYEVIGKQIKARTEDINTCWGNQKSAQITVASSVKLSKDVLRDVPITFVPVLGDKLRIKYSILVKQYGISQEEFEYWTALSKTNEGTGGLFDPQPSQVTGNLSCLSDPNEIVFGFFSASSLEEKRLFITERLGGLTFLDQSCQPTDTLPESEAIRLFEKLSHLILVQYPVPGSPELWYTTGTAPCSDCRELGGTNKKPSFWK